MTALDMGHGLLRLVNVATGEEILFSTAAYSPKSGVYYSSLEPHDFSFNSPSGMCPLCHGLGECWEFDVARIIDPEKSIAEDCCCVAGSYLTVRYGNIYRNLSQLYDFDLETPWKELPKEAQTIFLYGNKKKWTAMHFVHPEKNQSWTEYVSWRGVLHEAHKRYEEAKSPSYKRRLEAFMRHQQCPECKGSIGRAHV